jgi:very-short-patch-repair endonuclease
MHHLGMDVRLKVLVLGLSQQQHGVISTDQLDRRGVGVAARRQLTRSGILVRNGPRTYRVRGAPTTPLQRAMAAVLAAGERAALSHTSALGHWGVRGLQVEPLHVVRHRDEDDCPVPGVRIHEVRDLPADEVRVLDQVPVVSPALALLQFAGLHWVGPERLGRAVDAAWSDRLVSHASLDRVLQRMSQRGRPGLALLRAAVQERGPAYVPPASNLEGRVAKILADAGLPEFRRQVDTGDDERWIGRVDFRAVELPVILEVQSERFHTGLTATAADAARFAALEAAGFVVCEATDVEVFHRPEIVVDRVERALDQARSRRRAA